MIFPYEEDFSEIRFVSAKGHYMPYIASPESEKDISSTWNQASYVLAADKDFKEK